MAPTTSSDAILPSYKVFDDALETARKPSPAVTNGTVSGIDLRIGSPDVDPDQAITISIKYSKATMKARPPSLSKAWKAAMDLQVPPKESQAGPSSQLASSLQAQSQAIRTHATDDLAAMVSAEVKHYSTYVIRHQDKGEGDKLDKGKGRAEDMDVDRDYATQEPLEEDDMHLEEDEEAVAKEDIVKAWRFGSTWVPMEAETFEPLDTRKGVEILNFVPRSSVSLPRTSQAEYAGQTASAHGRSTFRVA